jgi:protein TonB
MNTQVAQRHPVGALGRIGIVAGLHLAVIYLVATGLGIVPSPVKFEPIIGEIFDEPMKTQEQPPDIPAPKPENPIRIEFERPVVDIVPTDAGDSITGEFVEEPRVEPQIVAPPVALVAVRADPRYPLSQPPYPMSAVRGEQEGAAVIEIYVLPNGRVGDARVVKSTGYPALDQSAVDEAKRKWRLLPATRDGEPYAAWHKMRVVFELKNR